MHDYLKTTCVVCGPKLNIFFIPAQLKAKSPLCRECLKKRNTVRYDRQGKYAPALPFNNGSRREIA